VVVDLLIIAVTAALLVQLLPQMGGEWIDMREMTGRMKLQRSIEMYGGR
jgi:hypothetical protein